MGTKKRTANKDLTMAKLKVKNTKRKSTKSNNSAAFVLGSLFGGLIGAATALWKTPQSGEQLRSRVTGALNSGEGEPKTLKFSTTPASVSIVTGDKAPGEATGELTDSGIGHAATTEELIRPPDTSTTQGQVGNPA
jgi:hypothetical protein